MEVAGKTAWVDRCPVTWPRDWPAHQGDVLRARQGLSPGGTHAARERTEARPEQACSWDLPENQQDADAGAFGRTVSRRSGYCALPGSLFWNVPRNGNDSYWNPQTGRWQFFPG